MSPVVRASLRALRKTPAFTIGAIATVALTVGATTAIFSVVHAVLLRQLPYRDVERVFWMWSDQPGRDRTPFNVPDFIDYRDGATSLDGLAGYFSYGVSLSDEAAGERLQGMRATGNFFEVIGARARAGRLLQSADEEPGADHVAVISEGLWSRRFGGDPGIVGRPIRLNGEPYVVVGVLARDFETPVRDVEVVIPFDPDRDPRRDARNSLNFVLAAARLRDGVAWERAASELTGIARRLQAQFPVENARKRGVQMMRVIDGIAGPFRTALLTLFAAVGAVLLIACANLANLMLTRASARRKEIGVQFALGASRAAVARLCLAEALMVGLAGGALGVLLAHWAVLALLSLAPAQLPRLAEVRVDAAVLLFSLAISISTALLFGVMPALASARVDVREALQSDGRGATSGGGWLRGVLVSAEVALSVTLLVVMTLLAKSFAGVQAVAPGFEPAGVLSARLTLPPRRFTTRESIVQFQRALRERLASLPQVTGTGAINLPPLIGRLSRVPFTVEGRVIEREQVPLAQFRIVSPGYFETMGIPLTRGRAFSERDTDGTPAVAVVNQALADQWLAGLDPIGARLLVDDSNGPPRPIEIVGVAGDVRQIALDGDATWDLYITYPQVHDDGVELAVSNMFWMTRTRGDPMALATSFTRELRQVDADVVASQIRALEQSLHESVAPRRFSVVLIATFGVAALVLAVTGIYAVIACAVGQRAREIGIRMALGARPSSILWMVMLQGLGFVAVGLASGMASAAVVARLLRALLFGLSPADPPTFVQVAATVAVAASVACAAPAMRALRAGVMVLKPE